MKAALLAHNLRWPSHEPALHGAEDRIKKCFSCFKTKAVQEFLHGLDGRKNKRVAFAVKGGYLMFTILCCWYVPSLFLKKLISGKDRVI